MDVFEKERGIMNAITMLTDDHQKLRPFLRKLAQSCHEQSQQEVNTALDMAKAALTGELDRHIDLEDTLVFPLLAQSIGSEMVQTFIDDHRQIQSIRDQLYSADSLMRRSLTLALDGMLQDHLDREENMLFPAAESQMAPKTLELEPNEHIMPPDNDKGP